MVGYDFFSCPSILILVLFTEISSHLWSLVHEYSFITETKSIRKLRASGSAQRLRPLKLLTSSSKQLLQEGRSLLSVRWKACTPGQCYSILLCMSFCNRDHTQLILSFRGVDQIKHLDFPLENTTDVCKITDPLSHVGRLHQHHLKPLSSARSQTLTPTAFESWQWGLAMWVLARWP